ncbi:MAG TPA: hypothetical protein VG889_02340 [Rhizomicrobium sp.]|nr:hypothetical protein [Rhizomicrobium sp.]
MSDGNQSLAEAVDAIVRKSRISTVATVAVFVLLASVFTVLSMQVSKKQSELAALQNDISQSTKTRDDLQAQIDKLRQDQDQLVAETREKTAEAVQDRLVKTLAASQIAFVSRPSLALAIQKVASETVASGAGRTVYIQYANPEAKPAMVQLQQALSNAGFVAPGIELVARGRLAKQGGNAVRYFWQDDDALAKSLAGTVTETLSKICPKLAPMTVADKATPTRNARPSLPLEVWIVDGC